MKRLKKLKHKNSYQWTVIRSHKTCIGICKFFYRYWVTFRFISCFHHPVDKVNQNWENSQCSKYKTFLQRGFLSQRIINLVTFITPLPPHPPPPIRTLLCKTCCSNAISISYVLLTLAIFQGAIYLWDIYETELAEKVDQMRPIERLFYHIYGGQLRWSFFMKTN